MVSEELVRRRRARDEEQDEGLITNLARAASAALTAGAATGCAVTGT